MRMVRHPLVAFTLAAFALSCGKKADDTSAAGSTSGANDAAESSTDTATLSPAPASSTNSSSAPLTPADVQRWERGIEGELKAVQAAGAKMKSARTGEDSLNP
jgi:hypothetical protein